MNELIISLSAEDFEKLVSGQAAQPKVNSLSLLRPNANEPIQLKIVLQDIGYLDMLEIIDKAIQR